MAFGGPIPKVNAAKKMRIQSLSDLEIKRDQSLFGHVTDGYWEDYKIEYKGNSVSLRSMGSNTDDPSDDIVIGPIKQ
jgi:hypothetical protein